MSNLQESSRLPKTMIAAVCKEKAQGGTQVGFHEAARTVLQEHKRFIIGVCKSRVSAQGTWLDNPRAGVVQDEHYFYVTLIKPAEQKVT